MQVSPFSNATLHRCADLACLTPRCFRAANELYPASRRTSWRAANSSSVRVPASQADIRSPLPLLNRSSPEIGDLITDTMDMKSLLAWRRVSRAARTHVASAFQTRLRRLLALFLPATRQLLRTITECRALIGGEVALAFLLRDPDYAPLSMDIFTTDQWFHALVDYLTFSPFISPHLTFHGVTICIRPHRHHREVRRCATFIAQSARIIRIYESTSISAVSPISRSWTSALMNYVTATSFGCAYPELTFNRLALVSEMCLTGMTLEDHRVMGYLRDARFLFAFHPAEWPRYSPVTLPGESLPSGVFPCLRHRYICPDQGRYFGDDGSLVVFMDPSQDTHDTAYLRSEPPYGIMVAWRMWVCGSCARGCAYHDDTLNGGVISMPMLLVNDRILQQPLLRDLDERSTGAYTGPLHSPLMSSRRRRRST